MDWAVIIRALNALGCLTALFFLIRAARMQWSNWNLKTQQHWWALAGWATLGFESSLETYFLHIQAGPRTVLTSLVVAWTVRALWIDDDLNVTSARRKDKK